MDFLKTCLKLFLEPGFLSSKIVKPDVVAVGLENRPIVQASPARLDIETLKQNVLDVEELI